MFDKDLEIDSIDELDELELPNNVSKEDDSEPEEYEEKPSNQKRQLEYFQKRRKAHYIKAFISRARISIRMIAILIILLVTVNLVTSSNWYLPKKIFNKYPSEHLVFEGNNITSDIKILNAIRRIKIPEQPVYLMDVKPFEKEIMKLSPIKKVYIKRFGFPAKLKIIVEEKKPVLSISPNAHSAIIAAFSKDGTIIGRGFLPLNKNIQTYRVLTYEDYFQWSKKQVEYLAYLAKTTEMYSKEEVQYVDLRNPDDVRIQIKSVNIRLGQLNKTVFKRLKKISAILPQALNLSTPIEYIDLRWNDSAYIKLKK